MGAVSTNVSYHEAFPVPAWLVGRVHREREAQIKEIQMKNAWWRMTFCSGVLVVAGCSDDAGGAGGGGAGGAGGATTSATTSATSTGGAGGTGGESTGGTGGAGGTGGGECEETADCIGCSKLYEGGTPDKLCVCNGPPASADVFATMVDCVCSKCSTECADNACSGQFPSESCQTCIDSMCTAEQDACLADQ